MKHEPLSDIYQGIFDALLENIALLDGDGTILVTNRAWERFARDNGNPRPERTGVGVNYLEVCRHAVRRDPSLKPVIEGLTGVMSGTREFFMCEYPCHSPDQRRWFLMHASQLASSPGYTVVYHINITQRKLAEEAHLQRIGELEHSLAEIQHHGHILPICGECRRIRDERGQWSRIEEYFLKHGGPLFSHGLCPDCLKKLGNE